VDEPIFARKHVQLENVDPVADEGYARSTLEVSNRLEAT
jgi:hypothetical protein